MYSYGPQHMAGQKQDDQHEHTFSSYVRIRDVALKTCQRRWTIGKSGERGSGISVLPARHDDDDIYMSERETEDGERERERERERESLYIYTCIHMYSDRQTDRDTDQKEIITSCNFSRWQLNINMHIYECYCLGMMFVCLFGFYGISTFVGYLIPNPFLYK